MLKIFPACNQHPDEWWHSRCESWPVCISHPSESRWTEVRRGEVRWGEARRGERAGSVLLNTLDKKLPEYHEALEKSGCLNIFYLFVGIVFFHFIEVTASVKKLSIGFLVWFSFGPSVLQSLHQVLYSKNLQWFIRLWCGQHLKCTFNISS